MDKHKLAWAMFLCRLFCGLAFGYFFVGMLLNMRGFATNLEVLGFGPWAVNMTGAVCAAGVLLCGALFLGYRTRLMAILLFLTAVVAGLVFAGNEINKIYLCFVLFSFAGLLPVIILGGGMISMDYNNAIKKEKKFLSR